MSGSRHTLELAIATGGVAGLGILAGLVYGYSWLAKLHPDLARTAGAERLSPAEPGDEVAVTLTIPKITDDTPPPTRAGRPRSHRPRPNGPGYRECGG